MKMTSFNDGWSVRPRWSMLTEGAGPPPDPVPVTLPHDAVIGLERDPATRRPPRTSRVGCSSTRRPSQLPLEWEQKRVVLRFEGVYRSAMVYVNDDFAASQPSGYAELLVPLDAFLRHGEDNTITVQATSHEDTRWYSGAGIYRDVSLLLGADVHIAPDGVTITTPEVDEAGATAVVETEVGNHARHTRSVVVSTTVTGPDGAIVAEQRVPLTLRPGTTAVAHQRIHLRAAPRWSVEEPNLHTCRTELLEGGEVIDPRRCAFGVRTLSLDPRHGLRINGETVELRGACIHHDNGVLGAATIGRAEERRIEMLKAAGFNAIRSAHNPMSRAMLDACDRLGMLVMDEAFDMWTRQQDRRRLRPPASPIGGRPTSSSMVRKDRNHPSVDPLLDRQRDPRDGRPARRDLGARPRRRRSARSTTPGSSSTRVNPVLSMRPGAVRRRPPSAAGPRRGVDPTTTRSLDHGAAQHPPGDDEGSARAAAARTGRGRADRGGVRGARRRRVQLPARPLRDRRRAVPRTG